MNKSDVLAELTAIVGPHRVLHRPEDVVMYEYDGALDRARPDFVVFPVSSEEVAAVVRVANRAGIPFMPRGAGTGLSGGAVPVEGGVVISFSRMNRILDIDLANLRTTVQPGVVNIDVTNAVSGKGFYYVPDPSSQKACTIGGNIAENSGGPHCLAYGVTSNHTLMLEAVLPDGDIVQLGAPTADAPGYDLTGLMVGSEGTLGLVTRAVVRLVHQAETVTTLLAVFNTIDEGSNAVSAIIADGTIPAALEMMDNTAIRAVEAAKKCGYPVEAGSVLLIDLEGFKDGLVETAEHIAELCRGCGATEVRPAKNAVEREKLWSGRKGAFGAMGRLSPSYYVQDGVIPRTKLPWVLHRVGEIGDKYGFRVANVFHAGDGNLHPLILFDERDPAQVRNVVRCGSEILKVCVEAGGSISGEHGIGVEKREDMCEQFTGPDLIAMRQVKAAFNPQNLCNPGKLFPTSKACYEVGVKHRRLPAIVAEEHML
ncbi:MAG: FAD-linked oxidase C-terminal domain-containing protein [Anaerolineae bacterium]